MTDSIRRVNVAIDECLEQLKNAPDPRAELRAFVELAEREGMLSVEELRTVESMVFRIILDREDRTR